MPILHTRPPWRLKKPLLQQLMRTPNLLPKSNKEPYRRPRKQLRRQLKPPVFNMRRKRRKTRLTLPLLQKLMPQKP